MKRILLFCFLALVIAAPALSQQPAGVTGLVSDHQSGEPLQGVTIAIQGPQTTQVISGLNGSFSFRKLTPGTYTVKVMAVGYQAYEGYLSVEDNRESKLAILLERKKASLEAVTVSGFKEHGSDLYAQASDRRASLVQNSVSARTIEISPDLSVANVTQRIPGVSLERSTNGEGQYAIVRGMDKRYIYTLVNGIKIPSPDNKNRYVPLDIFPADLLDRLEVSKSLTPDKEGDAIGGAVNMVMKDAPSVFSLKVNGALGYADKFFTQDFKSFDNGPSPDHSPRSDNPKAYQASMNDFPNSAFSHSTRHNLIASQLGFSAGGRLLDNKLGILVAGSYQNNYRNVNGIFFGTETDRNDNSPVASNVQAREYSIQQQRTGLHTRIDYQFNTRNNIKLYAGYMNMERNEFRYVSDTTSLQLGRTTPGTGRVTNSYRNLHEVQGILNTTLSGEHHLSDHFSIDWTGAYSKATGNRPDQATLNLNTGVSENPTTHVKTQAPLLLDPSSYREFTHSSDEDKSGYLKFTYRHQIGGVKANWIAGGMFRSKTRTSEYDRYELRPSPGIQTYDGNVNNNHFEVFNGEGSTTNALNYDAKEAIGAGFGMVKLNYKAFEVTGGARYEHTQLTWNSEVPETVNGKTGSIQYYDVLPSAHIKYDLAKKQVLRLSYYAAISRPNFYEVVPHIGGDADADYQEKGNPNLKRTTAENFDLRYEYYPHGLDQFIAGVFYKNLKNPIEYALVDEGTNTYYEPYNFGTAHNYGAEVDIIKYFRWFGIKANYTYTHSSITSTKRRRYSTGTGQTQETVEQERPLQGQSNHIANFSLLIKDDNRLGLNAQLAFGYTSRRINTVSQFLDNDIWQKGFAQMDFSLEKKIDRRWAIYAKVNNILNTPYQLEIRQPYKGVNGEVPYQEHGKNLFVRKDTYGASYLLGAKFKL